MNDQGRRPGPARQDAEVPAGIDPADPARPATPAGAAASPAPPADASVVGSVLEPSTIAPVALEEAEAHRRFAFGLERLVFFSDAVMAIAITLLVIDVRLPVIAAPVTDAALASALRGLAPQLFAFTLSFVVIAAFWLGHFRTFRLVARLDARLIGLDFLFLFIVAVLPFPTSVVASYGELPIGAVIYAAFVTAGGLVSSALWVYPMRVAGLGVASVTPEIVRRVTWRTLVIPLVFGISIPVALLSPLAADVLWILALPAQALASRRLRLSLTLA